MSTLAAENDNATADVCNGSDASGNNPHSASRNTLSKYCSTRSFLVKFLHWITSLSARNPYTTITAVTIISVAMFALGLATGFTLTIDSDVLWTPVNSKAIAHRNWIKNKSGFPLIPRHVVLFLHAHGNNVLSRDNIVKAFDALDTIRNLPGYQDACRTSRHVNDYGVKTCEINGVTDFWKHNTSLFLDTTTDNDETIINVLSAPFYPDGRPVATNTILGNWKRDSDGRLTSAQSMTISISLDNRDDVADFESLVVDAILDLDKSWTDQLSIEIVAKRTLGDEFARAIVNDIPLVPAVFVVMAVFTSAIFYKRDPIKSKSLLGFTAVFAVLLSIMTGYGLVFAFKIPFTSMTQLLPFVIFGVGLDDAYIITGSFMRSDPVKDPVERVKDTIDDIGVSITLTTLTSALAFALGTISTVPAIYWLCQYAFPTILIVYFYQLTFFIAAIVLDERRVCQRRRDCCLCITVDRVDSDTAETALGRRNTELEESMVDRFMKRYAEFLLKPWVKIVVIVMFCALLAACGYSASNLTQEFKYTELVPSDSYIIDFQNAFDKYTASGQILPYLYFRNVDQSKPEVRQQMRAYFDDMHTLDSVTVEAGYFWLDHFEMFVNQTEGLADKNFTTQLDAFLTNPVFQQLYGDDIVLDANGNIVTSRTWIFMDNVDLDDINSQVKAFEAQSKITDEQPINKDKSDLSFFTYEDIFNVWEFYKVTVSELIITTIVGILSVAGIALMFIPHWSATLFVLPMICVLYVDLLGVMQWGGVHINGMGYVLIVMSIGLLVDFILHILIRYYECKGNRHEKTVEMLHTMGSSILTGGVSTFLGTLPLAFSTSAVFKTLFVGFCGIVALGCLHGLVVLPVLLSIIGPEDKISLQTDATEHCTKCDDEEGASTGEEREGSDHSKGATAVAVNS